MTVKGTIFARMSPDQKQQLVQELQKMGYFVGQFTTSRCIRLICNLVTLFLLQECAEMEPTTVVRLKQPTPESVRYFYNLLLDLKLFHWN